MLALAVSVIGLWVIAPLSLFLIGKMSRAISKGRVRLISSPVDRAVQLQEQRLRLAKGRVTAD
jgi:hypothetical protein